MQCEGLLVTNQIRTLNDEQLKRLQMVYGYLAPYLTISFEKFELRFLRDSDVAAELDIWDEIIGAHRTFLERRPDATADAGHDVLKCLLMISVRGDRPASAPEGLWHAVNLFVMELADFWPASPTILRIPVVRERGAELQERERRVPLRIAP